MWSIYYTKQKETNVFNEIMQWKSFVFDNIESKIKSHFAKMIVLTFDNKMLFESKNGVHENLLESLANAEMNMKNYSILFPEVRAYLIKEGADEFFLAINNFSEEYSHLGPTKDNGFNFVKFEEEVPIASNIKKLEYESWSTLVFSVELSNFYKGWIHYVPNLKDRVELQTKYILENLYFKNKDLSFEDKKNYEETIKSHPKFVDLYEKLSTIIPKIEHSLEQEWKEIMVSSIEEKRKKKNKK